MLQQGLRHLSDGIRRKIGRRYMLAAMDCFDEVGAYTKPLEFKPPYLPKSSMPVLSAAAVGLGSAIILPDRFSKALGTAIAISGVYLNQTLTDFERSVEAIVYDGENIEAALPDPLLGGVACVAMNEVLTSQILATICERNNLEAFDTNAEEAIDIKLLMESDSHKITLDKAEVFAVLRIDEGHPQANTMQVIGSAYRQLVAKSVEQMNGEAARSELELSEQQIQLAGFADAYGLKRPFINYQHRRMAKLAEAISPRAS